MNKKIIKKTKENLRFEPNLTDYQSTYRTFSWTAAEKELTWFKGRKLNAAFNAIDRHLGGPRKNKVALYWHGPEDEKKKIFKEGYGKGTGYGLYLIRKMCEVYGWTIQETGKPGKGAEFTMTIPKTGEKGKANYKLH